MQNYRECFEKVRKDCVKYIQSQETKKEKFKNKDQMIKSHIIPLCFWINEKRKNKKTLLVGLAGGQGTGKTTISTLLRLVLIKYFKLRVFKISIDDFYKTFRDREKMSNKIHPLFKTRGVPGTHDINLAKNFFQTLNAKKFKKIKLPKFDKSIDDRLKKKYYYDVKKKPEIVILEGWCVGAKHQSNNLIKKPINKLEKKEDSFLIWRKYVNEKLKKEYKKIFSMLDHFIYMKIPNFNAVFKWRLLQEKKLRKKSYFKKKIMSYNEIKRFIMFYERITLQMIKDLSKCASMVILLKKNHEIKKILFKS